MTTIKAAAPSAGQHTEPTGGSKNQPPTKRLNVEMSEDEYYALKRYALEQRKTVSEVVREAISTQMSK